MFTHDAVHRVRRPLLALSAAASLVLGGALVSSAAAAEPVNGWEPAPDVSLLGFLLIVLIIPLGAAAVITLLTLLPSLARGGRGYEAGQPWRGDSEWFGGPTKGVQAADEVSTEQLEARKQETGGTSARW